MRAFIHAREEFYSVSSMPKKKFLGESDGD